MSHYDEERQVEKNKGGRPRKQVDYSKLDAMCAIHCTGEECASLLEMDYEALNRALKRDGHGGFKEYFKVKGANGKMSLRRKQYDQAMSGNSTMLIWLGKQWLGQSDKMEQSTEVDAKITDVKITVVKGND